MARTVLKSVLVIVTLGLFVQLASTYLEIDLQKIEQLDDAKYLDVSGLKIRRENKTRKIFGNLILKTELGNDLEQEVKVFKKSGSGYQLMPFKLPKSLYCDSCNQDIYFYPEFAALSDFPEQPIPCPTPIGNYSFYGFHYVGKNLPLMILPSGDYAVELSYWREGAEIFRFRGYGSVINI